MAGIKLKVIPILAKPKFYITLLDKHIVNGNITKCLINYFNIKKCNTLSLSLYYVY